MIERFCDVQKNAEKLKMPDRTEDRGVSYGFGRAIRIDLQPISCPDNNSTQGLHMNENKLPEEPLVSVVTPVYNTEMPSG